MIAGSLAGATVGSVAGGEDHRISGGLKGAFGGAAVGGLSMYGRQWSRGVWGAATGVKGSFNVGAASSVLKARSVMAMRAAQNRWSRM
jgi:hypothetical protein